MIENVKILLHAIVEVGESSYEVFKDGEFSGLKDIMEYVDDIPEIKDVIKNREAIIEELPILKTPEGRQAAIDYIKKDFDIPDDKLEELIESLIVDLESVIAGLVNIIGKTMNLFKKE